jgi:hypothetical protein
MKLACLLATLALCACGKGAKSTTDLDARCTQLAKVCTDEKHIAKLIESCEVAAKKQVDKGCIDKAIAAYDCEQKEFCGKDQVWVVDDLSVLVDRQNKCKAERDALKACVGE